MNTLSPMTNAKHKRWTNWLWYEQATGKYLLLAAAIMLWTWLGGRVLWTQEWRWAEICWQMLYSGDYLHPYLDGGAYYDKPLLSYWLMIICSHLFRELNIDALRLPSTLAGIVTIWSTYRIGTLLANKKMGLLAGWMLLTTYFFVFWARTASADALNLAGTYLAIYWYLAHRLQPKFINYLVFFLILAITALFKGLVGVIVPLLAVLVDVALNNSWRQHIRMSMLLAVIMPLILYILPFWASAHFGGQHYGESGLYEVYRENIQRYFHPFDHQGPIYTYIIYLPIYLLPWTLLFIPALWALRRDWKQLSSNSRWLVWTNLVIFLFFTLSGSRRNYYILPLLPLAILLTADWLIRNTNSSMLMTWTTRLLLISGIGVFLVLDILQPLYYAGGGDVYFARQVQTQANLIQPWANWNIISLDARSKVIFYLNPVRPVQLLPVPGGHSQDDKQRAIFSAQQLAQQWPVVSTHPANTIIITRQLYLNKLLPYFPAEEYQVVIAKPVLGGRLFYNKFPDVSVAFIPKKLS